MKIHFIGIGGIGVSALAKYYLEKGHEISGSDLATSEITDALKKIGAKVIIGKHKTENLPKDAQLVIYSPAVQKNNLEFIQAKKYKVATKSYPEALGGLTKKHFTIAVSGTHGKSTTTAMIGTLLTSADLDPTVIVGTKLKEFGDSNCRVGKSKYLVIEADEHFASFLNYWPKVIVLTTLEEDHLDYYKNLKNILKTFKEYVGHLPKDGVLIVNKDDKNTRALIFREKISARSSTKIKNFSALVQNYSLKQPEAKEIKKILKVPGDHNISNALAALSVARFLKIPDEISLAALAQYKGAWRRFEISEEKINNKKFTLISDYGHHPTEIEVTLKAAREKFPDRKIWCIFQPHQYQRTFYLFKNFVHAFKEAPVDKIIITDIYDVAGREDKKIKEKINAKKLVETINKIGIIYLPKNKIIGHLKKNLSGGEVVIIMGAGDVYDLTSSLKFST